MNTEISYSPPYRDIFICPYHNCLTENGWCWECAVETYGYDEAKRIYEKNKPKCNNPSPLTG
jgi:hypothetical protein